MHIQNQDRDDVYTQKMTADKSSQCGRSMLEILAVMFVVIAITVTALHGYRSTVKQHEADRIYEMILTEVAAVLNRGSKRTDKGIVDVGGNNGYTYEGKAYGVKMGCPQRGFSVKVADVDIDLCEKLLAKEWDFPVKPLAFFRSKNWGDLCESGSSKITQDGYFMTSGEDCSRVDVGMFVGVFPKESGAEEIQVCTKGDECYACQRCNQDRQICENNCPAGQKCLKNGNCKGVNSPCTPGVQYEDDDGVCQDCGIRTSCKYNVDTTDPDTDCPITSITCGSDDYCDADGQCQNCPTPAQSCAIASSVVNSTTGCVTRQKITCTGGKKCRVSTGACIDSCPSGTTESSGHCCPNATPVWNGTGCVAKSCTSNDDCDDGEHCDENNTCQSCPTPTQSCAIASNVVNPTTGCEVQQKITCTGGKKCHVSTGACVDSCPSGAVESSGHCCPNATPVWNGTGCVVKSCTSNDDCDDGEYCDENNTCQSCSEPETQSCAIPSDVTDSTTGCVVQQKITCTGGKKCRVSTGACIDSCPSGTTESSGHCCPNATPVWNGTGCVAKSCTSNDDCDDGEYCDENNTCQSCSEPETQSCAIPSDVTDSTTGCVTTQKITCTATQGCAESGLCVACPGVSRSDITPSSSYSETSVAGCYCPSNTPYWDGETCVATFDCEIPFREAKSLKKCPDMSYGTCYTVQGTKVSFNNGANLYNVDMGACDLDVDGALSVTGSLVARNVTVNYNDDNGNANYAINVSGGEIIANKVTGISSVTDSTGIRMSGGRIVSMTDVKGIGDDIGISMSGGSSIEALNGEVKGVGPSYGISSVGTNEIRANSIVGDADMVSGTGIYQTKMKAKTKITGKGSQGIVNNMPDSSVISCGDVEGIGSNVGVEVRNIIEVQGNLIGRTTVSGGLPVLSTVLFHGDLYKKKIGGNISTSHQSRTWTCVGTRLAIPITAQDSGYTYEEGYYSSEMNPIINTNNNLDSDEECTYHWNEKGYASYSACIYSKENDPSTFCTRWEERGYHSQSDCLALAGACFPFSPSEDSTNSFSCQVRKGKHAALCTILNSNVIMGLLDENPIVKVPGHVPSWCNNPM